MAGGLRWVGLGLTPGSPNPTKFKLFGFGSCLVFTHNNWTLSDEVIEIINSNAFYLNHVRWNIQRVQPSDVARSVVDTEDSINIELEQGRLLIPKPHTNNLATQETLEQQIIMNNNDADVLTQVLPRSTCSKRKTEMNANVHKRQI
ncbi:unnamed protein product [Rotaria socialis]|uniref:Uncharacterized protein n=2 Tax=Rotaria socialis TaxID=392032 RepID=A0A821HWY9_9BILA|nr:unnamed protein product [Rotaria socialis]